MKELEYIKALLTEDRVDEAIHELTEFIKSSDKKCDEAFYLLGNAYARLSDWKHAIENYTSAISINPSSPAVEALDKVQEILNFYCKDLYNP